MIDSDRERAGEKERERKRERERERERKQTLLTECHNRPEVLVLGGERERERV